MEQKPHKRKRGRNLKQTPSPFTNSTSSNDLVPSPPTLVYRRGRGRQRKAPTHDSDTQIAASSESDRGVEDLSDHDFELAAAPPSLGKVMHSMDAVVKVFCVHTEPNFSLPWQRKRQYSSSSSGFIIGGRRVLTNAHSVEHYTQVKLKKRGSDTKYLATVLAIGTECDIERELIVEGITWYFKKGGFSASHSRFCL